MTGAVDTRPLGGIAKAACLAGDIAWSMGRLLARPMKRTRQIVDSEYDGGHWRRMLLSRNWERYANLADFLVGDDSSLQASNVNGQVVRISRQDYYRYRLQAFPALISSLAESADEIVEVGSGYGFNLFSLANANSFRRFSGFDISSNGLEASKLIAGHFGLADRFDLGRLDLSDGSDPNFSRITGRVIFSYFCLEQIPNAIEKVVANLISARPSRVIHIEPTTELLNLARPRDLASYLYIRSVDYQTRLFTHLDDLDRRGIIRIRQRMRMPFAPTIHNDGFAVVWEPAP